MRKVAGLIVCQLVALLAGASPSFAEAGSLDASFGRDGTATTSFGTALSSGNDVAVQADGRILVAGSDGNPSIRSGVRFALARHNRSGSLDSSFSNDGLVRTSFESGDAYGAAVAVQTDGRIVLAGTAGGEFAIARYNANGSLNRSFGSGGRVTTSFGRFRSARANAVAIQGDGRILVAGTADREFALARYDSDGSLDPSFGGDGKVMTNVRGSAPDEVFGIALQADGRIVVAGRSGYGGFALARYRADGSLDRSFGRRGTVRTTFGPADAVVRASAEDVVIQADGKIVAAGWAGGNFVRAALARYRSDGTLDRSFGGDGRVRTNFGQGAELAAGVVIQADGAIVAGGMAADFHEFAVARYLVDGNLDPDFGIEGRVVTPFRHGDAWANAVAIQANGKLVLAGTNDGHFALARYLPS